MGSSVVTAIQDFFARRGPWGLINQSTPVPLQAKAYNRSVQDQQPRLSLQTLDPSMFVAAASQMTLGNPSPMARISSRIARARATMRSPADVKRTRLLLRSKIGTPS